MTKMATAWAYVKKYWALVLMIAGAVVGVLLLRQREVSFADNVRKIQDAHCEELRRIQDARDQERLQHEANLRHLQSTLEIVQKHYDEAKRALDEKKKAQVEELVKKYGDDPNELAKQLSNATGFTIVLPE